MNDPTDLPDITNKAPTDLARGKRLPSPSSDQWILVSDDWSGLSDDDLQAKYEAAEAMQGVAFLLRCKAVHQYRENHVQAWGGSWTEQAIERFNISRRYCEAFTNIWEICVNRDAYFELVTPLTDSRSLMQFIGRKRPEDGAVAMEAAVAHYAEYNEPPTVAKLTHELGEGRPPPWPTYWSCPGCGLEGRQSTFKDNRLRVPEEDDTAGGSP